MAKSAPLIVELGPESLSVLMELTEALKALVPATVKTSGLKVPVDALMPKYASGGYVTSGPSGLLMNTTRNSGDQYIPKSALLDTSLKAFLNVPVEEETEQ